jgi:hypothetical protein
MNRNLFLDRAKMTHLHNVPVQNIMLIKRTRVERVEGTHDKTFHGYDVSRRTMQNINISKRPISNIVHPMSHLFR